MPMEQIDVPKPDTAEDRDWQTGGAIDNQSAAVPIDYSASKDKIQAAVPLALTDTAGEAKEAKAAGDAGGDKKVAAVAGPTLTLMTGGEFYSGKKLTTGDVATQKGNEVKLQMPDGGSLTIDTNRGTYSLKGGARPDVRRQFNGTPWETTQLRYPNGDTVNFDKKGITGIHRGDDMIGVAREKLNGPPVMTTADMVKMFKDKGSADLAKKAEAADKEMGEQLKEMEKAKGEPSDELLKRMTTTMQSMSDLSLQLVKLYPEKTDALRYHAEFGYRVAADSLATRFGANTPEAAGATKALKTYLEGRTGFDKGEVNELRIKLDQADKMQKVIDIAKTWSPDQPPLLPRQAEAIKAAFDAIKAQSGPAGLAQFVDRVNERVPNAHLEPLGRYFRIGPKPAKAKD